MLQEMPSLTGVHEGTPSLVLEHPERRDNDTPINSLPEEILALILIEEVSQEEFINGWQIGCWRRRVELTSVCQRWRRVTLDRPAFWAGMYLNPSSQVSKMLPRWKNCRRRVWIHLPFHKADDASEIFEKTAQLLAVEQLGELSLHTPEKTNAHLEKICTILPQTEAPALHSLQLISFSRKYQRIPAQIFQACTSALRHLTLTNCAIDWGGLVSTRGNDVGMRNLLTLSLEYLFPGPPSDILNRILHSSAHLQHLSMIGSLADDYTPTFQWPHLHLQECRLEGLPHEPFSRLLARILSTPVSPESDIQFTFVLPGSSPLPTPLTLRDVVQRFMKFINEPARLFGKTITLQLYEEQSLACVKLWESKDGMAGFYTVHSNLEVPPSAMSGSSLVKQLNVPQAQIILLSMFENHPLEDWRGFFDRHPNVEVLKLGDLEHALDIFPLLAEHSWTSRPLILPKLRKISFQSVPPLERGSSPSFTRPSSSTPSPSPPPRPPPTLLEPILQMISMALISRFHHGAPITKLEFLNCFSVPASFIEEVKKRVSGEVPTQVLEMDMGEIEWEMRDSERRADD